jgi:hypothetical protein
MDQTSTAMIVVAYFAGIVTALGFGIASISYLIENKRRKDNEHYKFLS